MSQLTTPCLPTSSNEWIGDVKATACKYNYNFDNAKLGQTIMAIQSKDQDDSSHPHRNNQSKEQRCCCRGADSSEIRISFRLLTLGLNIRVPGVPVVRSLDGTISGILLATTSTMTGGIAARVITTTAKAIGRPKASIIGTTGAIPRDRLVAICRRSLLGFLLVSGHPVILAVPEWPGITETVTDSNGAIALPLNALEHVLREVVDSLFMGVMGNDKPRLGSWVAVQELVIKDILGPLNQIRTIVLVVIRVNVIQNDVVSTLAQLISALCVGAAAGIGRSHVSGEVSEDIA